MQVSSVNDVKIYNLSAGKSLPEWISERKRRKLTQKDVDIRRRVELIQDFTMPDVSNCVRLSKDGQYIFATGTYKPRVRCYDVNNLSMKFERCLDAEVIKMDVISDSYEKLVFLEEERYVEFHVQYGHYHRTRIPKFGRDMNYDCSNCELYLVGSGPDIYRLNLEQGRYMTPMTTQSTSLNCCDLNAIHGLFVCGTTEGQIESWDPRDRQRVATLDCALSALLEDVDTSSGPLTVSAIKFRDALTMAVGTSTGQILMYDIRSKKPILIKDHQYGLPIKSVDFCRSQNLVLSMDSKVVKIWNENTGRPYASIESEVDLNDLCLVPNSGLMFLANEAPKILTYYVPSLGPAPRWCSFLDNITEELEETDQPAVFDDYKFVTSEQLETLGMGHLVGTNLLRAYMHGYFMDARLYKKTKQLTDPFAFEKYRKGKIREKIDQERTTRVSVKKDTLPKINRAMAERLMLEEMEKSSGKKKARAKVASGLLQDDRFKSLFENVDFQIDPESDEFRLLNPALEKLEKSKQKRHRRLLEEKNKSNEQNNENNDNVEELEGKPSSEEENETSGNETSSDEDIEYTKNVKKVHRDMYLERKRKEKLEDQSEMRNIKDQPSVSDPQKFQLHSMEQFHGWNSEISGGKMRTNFGKMSLGERLDYDDMAERQTTAVSGGQEVKFKLKRKSRSEVKQDQAVSHIKERRKVRRSAAEITKTLKEPPGMTKKYRPSK